MPTGLPSGKTKANNDWVIHFSNFESAWSLPPSTGGKQMGEDIVVLHPDTGYTRHPELMAGNRYFTDDNVSKNFYNPKLVARDSLLGRSIFWFPSHGTSTASVLMSSKGHPNDPLAANPEFPNYQVGGNVAITGVAPGVWVIPCMVTRSVLLTERSDAALAKALHHAIGMNKLLDNVGVISISLGRRRRKVEKALKLALKAAREDGIVVCAAAGQTHKWLNLDPIYPGADPNTICCAACDSSHKMLESGHYGEAVDITAPGVDVWIAKSKRLNGTPVEDYLISQSEGTSYATAIVAGACALWQAYHGRDHLINTYGKPLIFDLFKEMLKRSCDTRNNTWDTQKYGLGVLDALELLQKPLPSKSALEQIIAGG